MHSLEGGSGLIGCCVAAVGVKTGGVQGEKSTRFRFLPDPESSEVVYEAGDSSGVSVGFLCFTTRGSISDDSSK